MAGMRTPLKMARNLGSAHHGAEHWWIQRMTSVALVPLGLWVVFSLASLNGVSYREFVEWLGHFGNSLMMILFVIVMFHHAAAGLQVVIEDYVHGEGLKMLSLIFVKFFFVLLAAGCVLSIIRVSLGS